MKASHHTAFTLLELLVVIAIIAMVTAIATVRFGGSYQEAQLKTAIARWQATDAYARELAEQQAAPLRLVIDPGQQSLELTGRRDESLRQWQLPSAVQITRVLTPDSRRSFGQQKIRLTSQGVSESYAVRLELPSGEPTWLVFAGLTGQCTLGLTTRDVEQLFDAHRQTRPYTP